MMIKRLTTVCMLACAVPAQAEVYVGKEVNFAQPAQALEAKAGAQSYVAIWGGSAAADLSITIDGSANLFSDITLFVCNEDELTSQITLGYSGCTSMAFDGQSSVTAKAAEGEALFVVLDNRKALLTSKSVQLSSSARIILDDEMQKEMKTSLEAGLRDLHIYIEAPEFNVQVATCGMNNAFSTVDGGHITMCWELIFDTIQNSIPHASSGIFAHELGHTLPNLWGSPHYGNEKAADEFAVAMLFITDSFPEVHAKVDPATAPNGPEDVVLQLISYFDTLSNLPAEVQAARLGGQHPLSVQRVNHLRSIMSAPAAFMERWPAEIYPHLTASGLKAIVAKPHLGADLELARALLLEKS